MILNSHNGSFFIQFPSLVAVEGLTHAVSCRPGGASAPPFDGLNTSVGVGDDPACVATNRRWLRSVTGGQTLVFPKQNHGTSIAVVSKSEMDGARAEYTWPTPADALITDVPGSRLVIQTADCQAVMLADPVNRVVANVHSGWRGSVANIIGQVVQRMVARFGCRPADMVAAIGPSLGPCCAEFVNYRQEIPEELWPFGVGQDHFDFWGISRYQLTRAGLEADRIQVAGICTRCNPHLFYSYRAANQTGRFAALIGLDETDKENRS